MPSPDTNRPLTGQVALVTGGARGIGAAAGLALAEAGATVWLADVLPCEAAVAAIAAAGGNASGRTLDIRDAEDCRATVAELLEANGRIDMLVCNAGVCPPGEPVGGDEQWERVLDINLNGTRNCIAAGWQPLIDGGGGSIVIVSSMAYYQGGVIVGAEYTASKAALIGLTRHLARNGGKHGIRCNAVCPGFIETDMTADFPLPDPATIPLGRRGTADEVAGPIRFLCSPDSSYMTGAVLNVTGGVVLAA